MGLLCFFMTYWKLSPPKKNDPKGRKESSTRCENVELNLFGILSLGILITGVMLFCQILGEEGTQNQTMLLVILGSVIVSGIAYGCNEQFWTQSPLMPLSIITNNQVWAIYLIQFLISLSAFGVCRGEPIPVTLTNYEQVSSNISEFLIRTRNATNRLNGTSLIFLPVGSIFGSVIAGYMMRR